MTVREYVVEAGWSEDDRDHEGVVTTVIGALQEVTGQIWDENSEIDARSEP